MVASFEIFAVVLLSTTCSCQDGSKPAAHTVPGPEADNLLPRAHGVIVMTQSGSRAEKLRLPELTVETLRGPDNNPLSVYSVAGPDSKGRIAFVENDPPKERHALKIVAPEGKIQTIFEAAGDA